MATTRVRRAIMPAGTVYPSARNSSKRSFYASHGKRCFDIVAALALLMLTMPLILILALAVGVTSGWPLFYRANRVGRDGRPFKIIKLRTMVRDADALLAAWRMENPTLYREFERDYKLSQDPRVTPLGRFLRRSSLDELPQLLNVIAGDMSLVGPRPIVTAELEKYGDASPRLLCERPGLTGAWQVGGRNQITYTERARIELDYVSTVGFLKDVTILAATFFAPFRFNGA